MPFIIQNMMRVEMLQDCIHICCMSRAHKRKVRFQGLRSFSKYFGCWQYCGWHHVLEHIWPIATFHREVWLVDFQGNEHRTKSGASIVMTQHHTLISSKKPVPFEQLAAPHHRTHKFAGAYKIGAHNGKMTTHTDTVHLMEIGFGNNEVY